MKKYLITLAAVASVGIAHGAIITETAASFTVANDDLLQTSLASVSADPLDNRGLYTSTDSQYLETTWGANKGEVGLRNGTWDNSADGQSRGIALVENDEQATYNLDLTASPLGYKVDQIDLYSNWGAKGGRDRITLSINYWLVGSAVVNNLSVDGTTAFDYNPVYVDVDTTQGKMSLTELNLTGVSAVQFQWGAQENNAVGYSELDVIGSAIPEPVTLGLVAAFGGGVLFIRRRFKI